MIRFNSIEAESLKTWGRHSGMQWFERLQWLARGYRTIMDKAKLSRKGTHVACQRWHHSGSRL